MDMDTAAGQTRALFAPLIQRPALTDQLLQRPPFKFIHDIAHETLQQTGYLHGLFTDEELDATKAGSSRDRKVAFLQKLIDALNLDGHLDNVNPAKIVAGKEAEMTNLLLQSLASEAALHQKAATTKKSSSSAKSSTTTTTKGKKDEERRGKKDSREREKEERKEEKAPTTKPKHRSTRDKEGGKAATKAPEEKKRSKSREAAKGGGAAKESKDKERRKRSDSVSRAAKTVTPAQPPQQSPVPAAHFVPSPGAIYRQTAEELSESRTPPDRESSGGTSKGGDDSGIAEETGAESERHDSERYAMSRTGFSNRHGHPSPNISTPDFIEVHPSSSSSPAPPAAVPLVRPGTAMGRPQTAIGRPGTAVSRLAPPKPKKNVLSAANASAAEDEKPATTADEQKFALILEEEAAKADAEEKTETFLVEEDEEQLMIGAGEGANVAKLHEGEEHGMLVNRIVENTRKLEEQEEGPFVEADSVDVHEQRRMRGEIECVQRALQRTTQNVQPLVRTLEFVADDFEAMLRELEDCRKQSTALERTLQEAATVASSQSVQLSAVLRALDEEMRDTREQLAASAAAVLENERKIAAALLLPITK